MTLTPFQQNGAARSSGPCLDAELLASYVDGRTTPEERGNIEAHVAHCEDCYFIFSETVHMQEAQSIDDVDNPPQPSWRRWMPRAVAGLATAAAVAVAVRVFLPGPPDQPKDNLQLALSEFDAAVGPYRKIEPRLTGAPTYRQLQPAVRSVAPSAEEPFAVREAAVKVERAARANMKGAAEARALAATYVTTGDTQQAIEVLQPLASSRDGGVLNDLAAVFLARGTADDAKQAKGLLDLAVSIDPNRAEVWFNIGLAAEASGEPARAIEAWTRFLALDSTSGWAAEAHQHLANLQRK